MKSILTFAFFAIATPGYAYAQCTSTSQEAYEIIHYIAWNDPSGSNDTIENLYNKRGINWQQPSPLGVFYDWEGLGVCQNIRQLTQASVSGAHGRGFLSSSSITDYSVYGFRFGSGSRNWILFVRYTVDGSDTVNTDPYFVDIYYLDYDSNNLIFSIVFEHSLVVK